MAGALNVYGSLCALMSNKQKGDKWQLRKSRVISNRDLPMPGEKKRLVITKTTEFSVR